MTLRGFIRALVAVLLLAGSIRAQDVRPTARVDSNRILIGDWLRLHLEVEHPAGVQVAFPVLGDSLEGLEVVGRDSLVRETSGGSVRERVTYTITAFDSGTYVVPPLPFLYTLPGEAAARTAATEPIPVFVRTVAVDTSKEIKDIKPPLSMAITFEELLPYLIALVAAAALAWLVIHIVRKRRKGERLIPAPPPRPANELALEALRSLEAEKLWQRGKIKEYYSQLTDIVRIYLERRFGVPAMEMVTDEILGAPDIRSVEEATRRTLERLLTLSDLVKFAKFQPLPQEHEESLAAGRAVVEDTWRKEPAPAPPQEVQAP